MNVQDTTAKFGSPQYSLYNPPVGMEVTPFKKVKRLREKVTFELQFNLKSIKEQKKQNEDLKRI